MLLFTQIAICVVVDVMYITTLASSSSFSLPPPRPQIERLASIFIIAKLLLYKTESAKDPTQQSDIAVSRSCLSALLSDE